MKNGDLVVKYFPMAMGLATKLRSRFDDLDTLKGAALDGLIQASQRFDGRGVAFSTYAYHRITGAVRDAQLKRCGTRSHPGKRVALKEHHGGTYELHGLGFSLDAAMEDVESRDVAIMRMMFVFDMTQAEIARKLKRSECRVMQLKARAFSRIKANLAARGITRLEQIL